MYEDTLGELEIQVLATVLRGGGEVLTGTPAGWGGDRFRVYETPAGAAMVWYTVWDDAPSRFRFLNGTGQRLESRRRLGYRLELTSLELGGRPATRIVIAPDKWPGWKQPATVEVIQ